MQRQRQGFFAIPRRASWSSRSRVFPRQFPPLSKWKSAKLKKHWLSTSCPSLNKLGIKRQSDFAETARVEWKMGNSPDCAALTQRLGLAGTTFSSNSGGYDNLLYTLADEPRTTRHDMLGLVGSCAMKHLKRNHFLSLCGPSYRHCGPAPQERRASM